MPLGVVHTYSSFSIENHLVHSFSLPKFYRVSRKTPSRLQVITEIFNRVIEPLYGSQTQALRKIEESDDRFAYLMYEGEEGPVGVLVFKTKVSNAHANLGIVNSIGIKSLFLVNPEKNSGRGLGSALLNFCRRKVNELGLTYQHMHVTVSASVPRALEFFKKNGFKVVGKSKGRYIMGVDEYLAVCPSRSRKLGDITNIAQNKLQQSSSSSARLDSEARRFQPISRQNSLKRRRKDHERGSRGETRRKKERLNSFRETSQGKTWRDDWMTSLSCPLGKGSQDESWRDDWMTSFSCPLEEGSQDVTTSHMWETPLPYSFGKGSQDESWRDDWMTSFSCPLGKGSQDETTSHMWETPLPYSFGKGSQDESWRDDWMTSFSCPLGKGSQDETTSHMWETPLPYAFGNGSQDETPSHVWETPLRRGHSDWMAGLGQLKKPHRRRVRKIDIRQIRRRKETVMGQINQGPAKRYRVDDCIRFSYQGNCTDGVLCKITNIQPYQTLPEMLVAVGYKNAGPETCSLDVSERPYLGLENSPARAEQHGVIAIHLKVLTKE